MLGKRREGQGVQGYRNVFCVPLWGVAGALTPPALGREAWGSCFCFPLLQDRHTDIRSTAMVLRTLILTL